MPNGGEREYRALELEFKRVRGFMMFLCEKTGKPVPSWIARADDGDDGYASTYANRLEELRTLLYECCRSLTEEEQEVHIYDAHNKTSRDLASWWEQSQEWEEDKIRSRIIAKQRALKKLTTEEKEALGLDKC